VPKKQSRKAENDEEAILKALKAEQKRAFSRLHIENLEKPYFISHLVKKSDCFDTWGRYGGIYRSDRLPNFRLYGEVRVGGYDFDNTMEGGPTRDELKDAQSQHYTHGPIERAPDALRHTVWMLTDCKYKEALSHMLKMKAKLVNEVSAKKKCGSFSREQKVDSKEEVPPLSVDRKYWDEMVRRLSKTLTQYRSFYNSWVEFNAQRHLKIFVSTEGSEIITGKTMMRLTIAAHAYAEDGMNLDRRRDFYFRSEEDVPAMEVLEQAREEMARELVELQKAPLFEPYSGPVLLEPEAAGIFFHEAIGHRLEGERQVAKEEGHTFASKVGQTILPEFISIIDDPTQRSYNGEQLAGYYSYDDQGVKAQPVTLVKRGVLESFLLSRKPLEGFNASNGHARNATYEFPIARMANFFIVSHDGVSRERLKEMLMEETVRQKKPCGLIIKTVSNGETNTSRYSFQAFSGSPRIVYKVDLDSGEEKIVRGVVFVGTPLTSINRIMAAGDTYEVDNSHCGAESGSVPVSTVAPPILVGELELQRAKDTGKRPPILPPPPL